VVGAADLVVEDSDVADSVAAVVAVAAVAAVVAVVAVALAVSVLVLLVSDLVSVLFNLKQCAPASSA
jgi:hypothetical protein